MTQLIADCPRCSASKTAFDVLGENLIRVEYEWLRWFELFSRCRHCNRATTFVVSQKGIDEGFDKAGGSVVGKLRNVNDLFRVEGFVSLKDDVQHQAPESLPEPIESAFREGATCLSVECWNAAGTMFRLAIDLATQPLLPKQDVTGLNEKTRRDLGLRLPWLISAGSIPPDLAELAKAVKLGGDDGAHIGGLTKHDADDLLEFTTLLLDRLFSQPARLKRAKERHLERRGVSEKPTK